jgi:hypothetical protein
MARGKELPRRNEVAEKVEDNKREMEGKAADLEKLASDVETIRHTIEQLDLGGTADGFEQVKGAVESAENVTEEVFDREDESLDRIQADNEEFEGELEGGRESSESDLGKISDASAKIETKETVNELLKAKEAVLRDIDFLAEQINRASDAKKESDSVQERLQARVRSGKQGR